MAYLQILKGAKPGRFDLPTEGCVLIGRSLDCGVLLDAGAVSRHHAQIACADTRYAIEDLKSRNGTYVNGIRIAQATPLADNDRVKICDNLFTFHSDVRPVDPSSKYQLMMLEGQSDSAMIMSTLDASTSSGIVLEVRPEAKLRAVLEITRNLGAVLRLEDLLPKILDSLFKIFSQADRGFILLRDEATNRLIPKAVKNRRNSDDDSVRVSRTIVKQVMENGQAILSADASSDSQFNMSQSITDFRIRSIMCVPLVGQANTPLGIIQIHTEDRKQQFTQEDLDVLASVAGTATIAIENVRLHEDLIEQEHLRRELQFAREVQRGFLPSDWPEVPGYEFYSFYESAQSVGGDYYGFIDLPDHRLAMALGDVSGKGMPAALLMARLSSDVRFAVISHPDASAAIGTVNRSLREAGLDEKFVTLLLAVLDKKHHTLSVANAGHMPPLLRHPDGTIEEVGDEAAGLPLTVSPDPDYAYQAASVSLEPGARVLLYTDGVSEAMNPSNELFGIQRLRRVFREATADPTASGEAIMRAVRAFAAGRHQSDDITLICFGRTGKE